MIGSGTARVRLEPLSEMPAASWRVQASLDVEGYDALSRLHRPGELLLLKSGSETLLLRVVGGIPDERELDLLLSRRVYDTPRFEDARGAVGVGILGSIALHVRSILFFTHRR